jgi:hypothetical protein
MDLRDYFAAHAPPYPEWWARLESDRDIAATGRPRKHIGARMTEWQVAWAWYYASTMMRLRGNISHLPNERDDYA